MPESVEDCDTKCIKIQVFRHHVACYDNSWANEEFRVNSLTWQIDDVATGAASNNVMKITMGYCRDTTHSKFAPYFEFDFVWFWL